MSQRFPFKSSSASFQLRNIFFINITYTEKKELEKIQLYTNRINELKNVLTCPEVFDWEFDAVPAEKRQNMKLVQLLVINSTKWFLFNILRVFVFVLYFVGYFYQKC